MAEVEWNTQQLQAFAKSLNHDKDGRALRKQMQAQFDGITERLRERMQSTLPTIQGAGNYPSVLAESIKFTTKLIGSKKAGVRIVGEARTSPTAKTQWREVGKFLEQGYLYHPAWGHWREPQPPDYLRQEVPDAVRVKDAAVEAWTPDIREQLLTVLNDHLEQLTKIRGAS